MISDILIVSIAFIWLVAASIQDIKKREIANWLSFSLIAVVLSIRLITAIVLSNWSYFLFGLLGLGIFFGFAMLLYYSRVFAGGDVKLLSALGAVFATQPYFVSLHYSLIHLPFLLVFILNMLFIASIYGILISVILAFKTSRQFSREAVKLFKGSIKKYLVFVIISIIMFIVTAFTRDIAFLTENCPELRNRCNTIIDNKKEIKEGLRIMRLATQLSLIL